MSEWSMKKTSEATRSIYCGDVKIADIRRTGNWWFLVEEPSIQGYSPQRLFQYVRNTCESV